MQSNLLHIAYRCFLLVTSKRCEPAIQARLLVTGCVALHRQVNIKQGDIKKAHPLGWASLVDKAGSDLLYRLHPCRRPFGFASLIQKRSRRFCHGVQVGHGLNFR